MSVIDELPLKMMYGQGGPIVVERLMIPLAIGAGFRPKPGPDERGCIYDAQTKQLLEWGGSYWRKTYSFEPVETLAFPMVEPRFAASPRADAPVTCLPGSWAGYPAPDISFQWYVDGALTIVSSAQFGKNADELAILKQGREIKCVVQARQVLTVLASGSNSNYVAESSGQASGLILKTSQGRA